MPDYQELCLRCGKVTPSKVVCHASGTEFLCAVCGNQVDFLHDEEDDEPYFDRSVENLAKADAIEESLFNYPKEMG
jgi:hypothetical protein